MVRDINQARHSRSRIDASNWTRRSRWAILATAFDYAVGCFIARSNIESVFERLDEVADVHAGIAPVCNVLAALVGSHLAEAGRDGGGLERLDAFRALLLIAEIDAVYRSRGRALVPEWLKAIEQRHLTSASLTDLLRQHYPDEAVLELDRLLSAAARELPLSSPPLLYNPVFGGAPGLEHIGADGDLIAADTLIDFKVTSKDGVNADSVWQLLGYAALDAIHGKRRIAKVGLYNPRDGFLWIESVQTLVHKLGVNSIEQFSSWWKSTPEANRPASE